MEPVDLSNEKPYQHAPLRKDTAVRLLKLLPGEYGAPLQCQIAECERTLNATYEALSYTWGDPVFPEVIHICDASKRDTRQYIHITANLDNAMQRMRDYDKYQSNELRSFGSTPYASIKKTS